MRLIIKLLGLMISITYFLLAAMGSLLVLPCKLLSIIFVIGGIVFIFDTGTGWGMVVICFVSSVLVHLLPTFLAIYVGRFLLWIKDRMYGALEW